MLVILQPLILLQRQNFALISCCAHYSTISLLRKILPSFHAVLVIIQTLIPLQRQNFALVSCCDRDSPTLIRLQQQNFALISFCARDSPTLISLLRQIFALFVRCVCSESTSREKKLAKRTGFWGLD